MSVKTYKKRRKLDTQSFIELAKEVHSNKYIYDKSIFVATKKKLTITCPVHGNFEQSPASHLNGRGCPRCAGKNKTTEEVIEQFRTIHGYKYDYSKLNFINTLIPLEIICPVHGKFTQLYHNHLRGQGCILCADKVLLTTEEFIRRAREVHGDFYDYSKVIYRGNKEKVTIICPVHGDFEQVAGNHLQGQRCIKCVGNGHSNTEDFIRKVRKIHRDFYNYSKVDYKGAHIKVEIICPIHGSFWQKPNNHLNGQICPECSIAKRVSKGEVELKEFIKSFYQNEIISNSRKIISPKELDIFIPKLKLAFEYNGDYWHRLQEEKNPGYHEDKRNRCKKKGITLIEIWERDWKKNKDQIKDLIRTYFKGL